MTDTTTADKIAAGELIQKCELMVWFHHAAWACESTSLEYAGDRQYGPTWTAAVRAWAEAAGVPWPKIEAVEMFALDGAIGVHVFKSMIEAECAAVRNICRYVPCVVVMNREGE